MVIKYRIFKINRNSLTKIMLLQNEADRESDVGTIGTSKYCADIICYKKQNTASKINRGFLPVSKPMLK